MIGLLAALMLPEGTAWAADTPPGDSSCSRACGGNFGTWFEQSPVVVCAVPGACTFGGKP